MMTLLEACLWYAKHTLKRDSKAIKIVANRLKQSDELTIRYPFDTPVILQQLLIALEQAYSALGSETTREVDYIFGLLAPNQTEVNHQFWSLYRENPVLSTQYLYQLGQQTHYIQTEKVALNQQYQANGIVVTINLSKAEKDNKEIALQAQKPATTFPKCVLCFENVGYKGQGNQPPRSTLRVAELTLANEPWFMQYSPYPYFEEHAIFIDQIHRPMKVDVTTLQQLIEIADLFPMYFVGSNAAMPIIGGSILSHAHFQGGKRDNLPLLDAVSDEIVPDLRFPNVTISTIKWPSFALRMSSSDALELKTCMWSYIEKWRLFEASEIGLIPYENNTPHQGVAPILYKSKDRYVAHLIFRSNITNENYPEGVFHAHPEFHHIKKEGIGLIEAMGMFILPGRLISVLNAYCALTELDEYYQLTNQYPLHRDWLLQNLLPLRFEPNALKAQFIEALSKVCYSILENISVFKKDSLGQKYQKQFLDFTL